MLRLKLLLLLALAAILLLISPAAAAQYQPERIYNFVSSIVVNKNASIDVTEVISVFANQDRITHGIIRRLPTRYVDSYGISRHTQYDIQHILLNDQDSTYHIERTLGQLSIYIGDRNTILSPGDYTYTIQYHVNGAINSLRDADELYWNITGNNWDFPIERAQANIQLPDGASISRYAGYTGVTGSKGQDYAVSQTAPNQMTFTTTRTLEPGEGLTVAAAWQKGIISQPTWGQWLWQQLTPGQYLIIEITFILIGYYLLIWNFYGRHPPKGTIIPLFEPPQNLTPEAMRYILHMGFNIKTFTVAIINMATEGYLKIENDNNKFFVVNQGKSIDILADEEKNVALELFNQGSSLELSSSNYAQIRKAQRALQKKLHDKYQATYFITNNIYLMVGALFTLFAFAAAIISADDPASAAQAVGWLSIWTFACSVILIQMFYKIEEAKATGSFLKILGATLSIIFVSPFLIGEVIGIYIFSSAIPIFTLPMLFFIVVINIFFYHLLKVPTIEGRKLMDQIEGFKLYLATTERYRLEQMNPPQKTPELFEKYLPYAIALDVENQWGENFDDVLRNAGIEPSSYHPVWYSGSGWSVASVSSMPLFIGAAITTSVISSSSSGSGGGGFSGGGGGGGGGGGW